MNVTDIVREWLLAHGYEGLCSENCGCDVDDLAPCRGDNCFADCVPAYRVSDCGVPECECAGTLHYHPNKEAKP